jgi:phosphoribosyl-dephospho-CoA transferase
MIYKRHDLVWLSDAGLDYALKNIQNCIPIEIEAIEKKLRSVLFSAPPIPAIVRRQEEANGPLRALCVGFSFPEIIDGTRLRFASKVPLDCVIKHETPFDVLEYDEFNLPDKEAIKVLKDIGNKYHTRVGLFGSAALQLVTGLPYRQKKSDLDVYLLHDGSEGDLAHFFRQLSLIEERYYIKIDAELECRGEYGVKLKELFGPGKTVLGKGLYDVILLEKKGAETRAFMPYD